MDAAQGNINAREAAIKIEMKKLEERRGSIEQMEQEYVKRMANLAAEKKDAEIKSRQVGRERYYFFARTFICGSV